MRLRTSIGKNLAVAAVIVTAAAVALPTRPAQALDAGAAVGIGLGSFALGTALGAAGNPYYNPYYPYGYYPPAYYPTAPYYYPGYRSCWDPYYRRYYAC
jgi:hypothetical protein